MSITSLSGKQVDVEISGNTFFHGVLVEIAKDILILFDGKKFIYIPFLHVHRINLSQEIMTNIGRPTISSLVKEVDSTSYRSILTKAKGLFTEIYVTGNKSIHGYITNVRSDYFSYYSPVFKTILISLHHLKWLIPYNIHTPPYTLSNEKLPIIPSNIPLQQSLEDQLKKWEGELVVFDLAEKSTKIGLLKKVENSFVELVIANGETVYLKLSHIKSVHLP